MIQEFLDAIQQRISDALSGLVGLAIVSEWVGVFVAVLLVCMLIGYFLPFQYVRAALGGIVWTAAAVLTGGLLMRRDYKKQHDADQAKIRQLQSKQQQQPRGWFN